MLVKVLNLPVWYRRLCAVALGLFLLSLAAVAIVLPVNAMLEQQTELADKRIELGRYLRIASTSASPDTLQNLDDTPQLFMSGANQAVIGAELQNRFNALAGRNAVTVLSVGAAPGFAKDGVRFVGIRTTLSGTIAGIHDTLFALEGAQPPLLVTKAKFLVPRLRPAGVNTKPTIQTQFTIFAATDPKNGEPSDG